MKKYAIFYGLGGGFGGAYCKEIEEFETEDQALDHAEEQAKEEYQSYEGLHGLRSQQEIMDEDGLTEEEADQAYEDEMDSWLDYWVEEYDPKNEDHQI